VGTFTNLSLSDDSISPAIELGFGFSFFDRVYSQVYIGSNGFLTFSRDQAAKQLVARIPSTDSPNNLICVWCTDLVPAVGSVSYARTGLFPAERFTVRFVNVPYFNDPANTVSFAVVLQPFGIIQIHYQACQGSTAHSVTIGLENSDGTDGVSAFDYNGKRSVAFVGLTAVQFSPINVADSPREYGCPDAHCSSPTHHPSAGAIAGMICGSVGVLLIFTICCVRYRRRKRAAAALTPLARQPVAMVGMVAIPAHGIQQEAQPAIPVVGYEGDITALAVAQPQLIPSYAPMHMQAVPMHMDTPQYCFVAPSSQVEGQPPPY